jgi:hypothetical protein
MSVYEYTHSKFLHCVIIIGGMGDKDEQHDGWIFPMWMTTGKGREDRLYRLRGVNNQRSGWYAPMRL